MCVKFWQIDGLWPLMPVGERSQLRGGVGLSSNLCALCSLEVVKEAWLASG